MPQFRQVSAKEIVARVIRSLGYKLPSHMLDDVLEFIGEGIGLIQVTRSLFVTSTGDIDCPGEVLIKNYCAKLPCGFINILAVEDEHGRRLPEGGEVSDITSVSARQKTGLGISGTPRVSVFEVDPTTYTTSDGVPTTQPGTSIPLYGQDLTQQTTNRNTVHYYKIQGNYIQTSFQEGFVKLHYLTLPVDSDGYPLIPDNENFKYALEWHIIRRLIGAGYEHKVFSYQYANEQYEIHAARGMAEVSYPSIDSMARMYRGNIRLIKPDTYDQDFGIGSEQPEILYK